MTITTTPLTPAIGAEITGIDLASEMDGGLDDGVFARIHQAVLDHLVLYFPAQDMAPEVQVAFTERFGAVEPHPLKARAGRPDYTGLLVLENSPDRRGARNDFWHSDISCAPRPPSVCVLHALIVPDGRGDTSFCNMYRAWETLPDDLRALLDAISAEHLGEAIRRRNNASDTDGSKDIDVPAPETHPAVRRHPKTGHRVLYTNCFFITRLGDMSEHDSAPLLADLEQRATAPDNVYRHRWRPGDVLIWDNRCTMHFADYDYDENEPRRMHRTTAAGERPMA